MKEFTMVITMKKKVMLLLLSFMTITHVVSGEEKLKIEKGEFITIAHRGASAYAPEHTMQSYKLAKEMNADYLEIDVQMTKDGVPIAYHDHKLDDKTDWKGEIEQYRLDEIKQIDIGKWFGEDFQGAKILTLEEIFKRFGTDTNYYIELKKTNKGVEKTVYDLLLKYDLNLSNGQVIIQSFSQDSLLRMKSLNVRIPLIKLLEDENALNLTEQKLKEITSYAAGVGVNYKAVTKDFVDLAHNNNLLVHAYTVNQLKVMNEMLELGVDGMFTNKPDVLLELSLSFTY
ncbi:glycerophosphodiester phosphodiesterase [Aquibacillus halophilus]|uniref:Glycerophosphodiester phosphodiesterase n=1 Tax=Aquibacillus halophilus TaxID=930132 RepID=A0A6A8D663_9BACI|nr:glycerophosphodiester phosphodiesterase family protein [Aquibacillus halophilus]MRH41265.1 glycerophosphodiester phosphodiesterase [Aquibacillus halophilus]